jgi:hypothetical protein
VSKVDLLNESIPASAPASEEDYGEGDDGFIDTPISQDMMARWMSAVG